MNGFIRKAFGGIGKKYYRYVGYYPAKIEGYNFKLNSENAGFWQQASKGNWEPETYKVLSQFLNRDSIYLDIGAWIGPTVTYAAKKCKRVICFEPDPVAYGRLLSNIHLNELDNVSPYNIAISDTSGIRKMSSMGGRLGDSMTSLLHNSNNSATSFDALVLDWDFIENTYNLTKVDLMKIDIEGGEFALIPKLEPFFKKQSPIVWLSLHAPLLDEHKRLKELQKVIDVMKRNYKICLNHNLEEIDFDDLKSDENKNLFTTFLFKN